MLFSQSGWYQQSSGTSRTLNSVYFVNENTGYVSGDGGVILKTTNKGLNWAGLSSGTAKNLYSAFFTDEASGYICGDSIILKTTNSGSSWSAYVLDYQMKSVHFPDSNTGFIVSYFGAVIKTTNAGLSWSASVPFNSANYTSVFFSDANTGYIVGLSGRYIKTTDGGLNWREMPLFYAKNYYSVQFPSRKTGYITGGWVYNIVMKSTDEGESFDFVRGENTGVRLFTSSFFDTSNGIAAGREGYIIKTTNGGSEWSEESPGTNSILYGAHYIGSNSAYAVGENGVIVSTVPPIGINPVSSTIPAGFFLHRNYPNPFNPSTKIRFEIPVRSYVNISVYNALGIKISEQVSQQLSAGIYETAFDAAGLPGGVYFYKLSAGNFTASGKMILVK